MLACSEENEGVFNPIKSRIQVFKFENEGRFVPYTCTQCDEAWCQKACPVDAISVDGNGAKVINNALCVGCKVCTIACPFGAVNYDRETKTVVKCDLCGGDPKCAEACPTDAITYVDEEQTGYERMRQYAERSHLPSFAG